MPSEEFPLSAPSVRSLFAFPCSSASDTGPAGAYPSISSFPWLSAGDSPFKPAPVWVTPSSGWGAELEPPDGDTSSPEAVGPGSLFWVFVASLSTLGSGWVLGPVGDWWLISLSDLTAVKAILVEVSGFLRDVWFLSPAGLWLWLLLTPLLSLLFLVLLGHPGKEEGNNKQSLKQFWETDGNPSALPFLFLLKGNC